MSDFLKNRKLSNQYYERFKRIKQPIIQQNLPIQKEPREYPPQWVWCKLWREWFCYRWSGICEDIFPPLRLQKLKP
jgi:hypothetical protein